MARMIPHARGPRRAGLLIPLFSFPSTTSWGIGEIGDLAPMTAWLGGGGQSVLQLLPLNEMASGQQSPYSALSAMAIDPIFITLAAVPEFAAIGGETSLGAADRETLREVRRAPRVQHAAVRQLKTAALAASFERFVENEWSKETDRARGFREFLAAEAWWIEDYGIFRALHARERNRPWTEWPEALQRREPAPIDRARRELSRQVLFHQYLQWLADSQWTNEHALALENGVELFGDLPFMVDGDSADVWARQEHFRLDVSIGVPPDAFSATGQDWGMPAYRWDDMAVGDFRWLRDRARRTANLYDGYRIDHLVGYYRTYVRPVGGGEPVFMPANERDQVALGERILGIFREAGAEIIAEDLGTVPDFVRQSLERLGIPGFKVFRWERYWHTEGQPFRDPADYPAQSVAASGTHDTEPVALWWETVPPDDRRRINHLPTIQRLTGGSLLGDVSDRTVRDTLLEAVFASGSDLITIPIQDAFGWRDRINVPARVDADNWTFRLPWPVDRLNEQPEARERQVALREWSAKYGRD